MHFQASVVDSLVPGAISHQLFIRTQITTVETNGFAKDLWVLPMDACCNVVSRSASDLIFCTSAVSLPHEAAKSITELENFEKKIGKMIPQNAMVVFCVGSAHLELNADVASFLHVHRKISCIATASNSIPWNSAGCAREDAIPFPIIFKTKSEFGHQCSPQKLDSIKSAIVLPLNYGFLSNRRLPTSVVTLDKNVRFVTDVSQILTDKSAFLSGMAYNAFPPKICCPAAAKAQQILYGAPKVDIMVCSNDVSSHCDSPSHFFANGRTISDLTDSELFAPAVIIDISSRVPANCDTNKESNISMFNVTVTVQDLEKWEGENGREIPRGAIVAMRSGWSELFNCGREYNNFDRDGVCHFPGFSIEAAKWLLEKRFIAGLAVDTLSVDVGSSSTYPVHNAVLGKSLFNVENLDLSGVPSSLGKNAHFIVAPLNVRNAPEAPCRCIVVEVLEE